MLYIKIQPYKCIMGAEVILCKLVLLAEKTLDNLGELTVQNCQFTEDAWLTNNMHLHYQAAAL